MKQLILNLFNYLGYRIEKIKPKRKTKKQNINIKDITPTKHPAQIEFIGVPGVGKSTLLEELLKQNSNVINHELFMQNYKKQEYENEIEEISFYKEVLIRYMNRIIESTNTSVILKTKLIQDIGKRAIEDFIINSFNDKYLVVSDEGFFKNTSHSIVDLYLESKEDIIDNFQNKYFIYCYNTPEKILEYNIKRYNENKTMIYPLKNKSYDEQLNFIKDQHHHHEEFVDLLLSKKFKVLKINTSNPIQNSINEINTFLNNSIN